MTDADASQLAGRVHDGRQVGPVLLAVLGRLLQRRLRDHLAAPAAVEVRLVHQEVADDGAVVDVGGEVDVLVAVHLTLPLGQAELPARILVGVLARQLEEHPAALGPHLREGAQDVGRGRGEHHAGVGRVELGGRELRGGEDDAGLRRGRRQVSHDRRSPSRPTAPPGPPPRTRPRPRTPDPAAAARNLTLSPMRTPSIIMKPGAIRRAYPAGQANSAWPTAYVNRFRRLSRHYHCPSGSIRPSTDQKSRAKSLLFPHLRLTQPTAKYCRTPDEWREVTSGFRCVRSPSSPPSTASAIWPGSEALSAAPRSATSWATWRSCRSTSASCILNGLASRSPILDPGVKRALRLLATGSAAVFVGNCISTWYLVGLQQNPPVTWADLFYLTDSVLLVFALLAFPLARRTQLERWKFGLDAAMVVAGGGTAIWYFSVRPLAASGESNLVVMAARLRLSARQPARAARHHDGPPAPADRRQPARVRTARVRRAHQRHRRPDVQPGAGRDGRAERELDRHGVHALLRDADLERRAVPAPPRARREPADAGPPAHPADQPPALPRGREHLRPARCGRRSTRGPIR